MRIFIGLVEIAGYYSSLKKGLEELGHDVTFVDLSGHPFGYHRGEGAGRRSVLGRLRRLATRLVGSERTLRALHRVLQTVVGLPLLLWGLLRYDVFIFGFGTSLLLYGELPILRWFGKKVIHVFNGSDVRPPYVNGGEWVGADSLTPASCIRLARKRKRRLRRIERHVDAMVDHVPQAHFHERPFVSWAFVGMPFSAGDPPPEAPPPSQGAPRPVRILHSPSNPEIKGTDRVRQAVRSLQADGHAIDYVEISGRPHAVVLQELARCDFVVDEIYSDNYMAAFATEAAFFGKPAVVGGYATEELERAFPPARRPPVLYGHPDALRASIERLVTDEPYRQDLGRRARQFVRTHYAPRAVAEAYVRIIEGNVPAEWLWDPAAIRHVHGMGMPEAKAREVVRSVIEAGGVAALQLADKPDLERRFLEFAGLGPA